MRKTVKFKVDPKKGVPTSSAILDKLQEQHPKEHVEIVEINWADAEVTFTVSKAAPKPPAPRAAKVVLGASSEEAEPTTLA